MDIEIKKLEPKSGSESVFEYRTFKVVEGRNGSQVESVDTINLTTLSDLYNKRGDLQIRLDEINQLIKQLEEFKS